MFVCKPPPSAQSQKPTALPCFACRASATAILTKRLVEPIGSLLLLDTLCLRHFGIGSTATPFDSWWHHERKSNFGFSLFFVLLWLWRAACRVDDFRRSLCDCCSWLCASPHHPPNPKSLRHCSASSVGQSPPQYSLKGWLSREGHFYCSTRCVCAILVSARRLRRSIPGGTTRENPIWVFSFLFCCGLLGFTEVYCGLLWFTGVDWGLLGFTGAFP